MEEKENLEDYDQLADRSQEVQEILGKKPNWIVRLGTTVVFVIITLLFVGSILIRYNDVISTQVVITSKNPPIHLKTRTHGRLAQIFVQPNQAVKEGDVLAEIESTARMADVLDLKRQIVNFESRLLSLDSMRAIFPNNLDLGAIQPAYSEFLLRYQNWILFDSLAPRNSEYQNLVEQQAEQKLLLLKQKKQLELRKKDLELSKLAYERQKKLFDKGVISRSEFENASRKLLVDEQNYESFKVNISNTKIAIVNYSNLITRGINDEKEQNNTNIQQLENARQNLNNAILEWEELYLLRSPMEGKVTIFDIWNENQNISKDVTLFTILPNETRELIGRIALPLNNSAKVKNGQKAIIKLTNYPFREWGSLEGRITSISKVPKQKEKTYTAYLRIEDLKTSYGLEIDFHQEMSGRAEIIIEELTLFQRILYEFRDIFENAQS